MHLFICVPKKLWGGGGGGGGYGPAQSCHVNNPWSCIVVYVSPYLDLQ